MFDYNPPEKKQKRADWTGLLITLCVAPVFFLFVFLGKPEMGFTTIIILGISLFAVKLRWRLRRHVWFWATIVIILALHVPLLFIIRWPQTNVPTIAYSLPLGIVDFAFITGAFAVAGKVFLKGEDQQNQ